MRKQQQGSALILVLISLTVLLFAALALFRSTETATAISSNIASKQAATQAADVAFAAAAIDIASYGKGDAGVANKYFPTQQLTDSRGLLLNDWSGVPAVTVGNFKVQYLNDRLCTVTPVTNASVQCATAAPSGDTSSKKVGAAFYIPLTAVYYRVSARVVGPKQSESHIQVLFTQ